MNSKYLEPIIIRQKDLKKVRKRPVQPEKVFKDPTKYTRKIKHRIDYDNQI